MEEEKQKKFQEFLGESLVAKGLSLEKLSELTSVPLRYLIALKEADFKKIPPIPYARGYLLKIAEVLEIDEEELLKLYKSESQLKTSGKEDFFPSNRFAIKSFSKTKIFIGLILLLGIIYLFFRIDDVLGIPKLKITNPEASNIVVHDPFIRLSGDMSSRDKLTINNEEIFLDSNGHFEKDYQLQPGDNFIEFKAKRFLGKEIKLQKEITYQP